MIAKPFRIFLLTSGFVASALGCAGAARADDDADNYTIEEVQACSGDAMRLCRDALPDVHKIETCMQAKKSQLSRACQAMFEPGHGH